ncbi:MAG: DVUA0089 family protein [Coriobacteriia bacterium]|nr:DVUA0089 family protein [Coriobacteriia bacterium]
MERRSRSIAVLVVVSLLLAVTPTIAAGVTATAVPLPDMYEDADDVALTAPEMPTESWHTFDTDADVDWMKFTVEDTGTPVIIDTVRVAGGGQGDMTMSIYGGDPAGPMTLLATDDDYETNWGTYDELIYFVAPEPGTYYVELTTDNPMTYVLRHSEGIARRISGENRYATSVAVSQRLRSETDHPWWGVGYSPDAIVVASGENFPDALAGVVLASYHESVLLLTRAGSLPAETMAEIDRLGQSAYWNDDDFEVIILGGNAAVSADVEDEIASLRSVTHVTRIAGANRHDTAALIAEAADDYYGLGTTAFIVSGRNFPDALAAGPVAAYAGGVVLTTEKDVLPEETAAAIEDLGLTTCFVVGGDAVISDDVIAEIEALTGSPTVERIAGANRYETGYLVAKKGVDDYGMNGVADNVDYGAWYGQSAVLVSGANFPDALSAGVMCWYMGSPMLLTHPSMLSADVETFLDEYGPTAEPSYVVGGETALSTMAFDAFNDYWWNWLP